MRASALALSLALAAATPALAATPEEDIAAVLDQLHAAAAKADGPAYFALYTPDAVFIGTDVTERWTIPAFRAYAQPWFDKGQGWTYAARERQVTIAPVDCRCVAWFDEVLDSKSYGTARGTGTLLMTPQGWRVSQYALTFPIPNAVADDVVAKIKEFEAAKK